MKRIATALLCLLMLMPTALAASLDGDGAISRAQELVHQFDPYGEDYEQERYLYRAEPDGDGWTVTVTVPRLDSSVDFYQLRFDNAGELTETVINPLQISLEEIGDSRLGFKLYCEQYGPYYNWSMEAAVEYENQFGTGDYRMPQEGDLSVEEVIAIARNWLVESGAYAAAELDAMPVRAVLNKEGSYFSNQWSVMYYILDESEGYLKILGPDQLQISNETGEVLEAFLSRDANG